MVLQPFQMVTTSFLIPPTFMMRRLYCLGLWEFLRSETSCGCLMLVPMVFCTNRSPDYDVLTIQWFPRIPNRSGMRRFSLTAKRSFLVVGGVVGWLAGWLADPICTIQLPLPTPTRPPHPHPQPLHEPLIIDESMNYSINS